MTSLEEALMGGLMRGFGFSWTSPNEVSRFRHLVRLAREENIELGALNDKDLEALYRSTFS